MWSKERFSMMTTTIVSIRSRADAIVLILRMRGLDPRADRPQGQRRNRVGAHRPETGPEAGDERLAPRFVPPLPCAGAGSGSAPMPGRPTFRRLHAAGRI